MFTPSIYPLESVKTHLRIPLSEKHSRRVESEIQFVSRGGQGCRVSARGPGRLSPRSLGEAIIDDEIRPGVRPGVISALPARAGARQLLPLGCGAWRGTLELNRAAISTAASRPHSRPLRSKALFHPTAATGSLPPRAVAPQLISHYRHGSKRRLRAGQSTGSLWSTILAHAISPNGDTRSSWRQFANSALAEAVATPGTATRWQPPTAKKHKGLREIRATPCVCW